MALPILQSWLLDASSLLPSKSIIHSHSAFSSSSTTRCNVLLLRGGRALSLRLTAPTQFKTHQPHQEEDPSSTKAVSTLLDTSSELQHEMGPPNLLKESSEQTSRPHQPHEEEDSSSTKAISALLDTSSELQLETGPPNLLKESSEQASKPHHPHEEEDPSSTKAISALLDTSSELQLETAPPNLLKESSEQASKFKTHQPHQEEDPSSTKAISILLDTSSELQPEMGPPNSLKERSEQTSRPHRPHKEEDTSLELQHEMGAPHPPNLLKESSEQTSRDLEREQRPREDVFQHPIDFNNLLQNTDPPKGKESEGRTIVDSGLAYVKTREQESPVTYVMTTPASKDSSPLAALKGEIERRVRDQLAERQSKTSIKAVKDAESRSQSEREHNEMQNEQVMQDATKESISKVPARESEDMAINESHVPNVNMIKRLPKATHSVFRIMEAERKARLAEAQAALKSLELDRLRIQLGDRQSVIRDAEIAIARADTAQALLQKLEMDVSKNVPVDVHEQAIRRVRELLLQARRKVSQITGHVKEKEEMLAAIKVELEAEQRRSLEKVKLLTSELSKRVPLEDMEIAIEDALKATNAELAKAQDKVLMLSIELEKKNRSFEHLREEWLIERRGLQLELETLKERLSKVHAESIHDKVQISELQKKVNILEEELRHFTHGVEGAEAHRDSQRQAMLHNIRLLVAEMMKISRAKMVGLESENIVVTDSKDEVVSTERKTGEAIGVQPGFVSLDGGTSLSGEGTAYLQKFFSLMGQLISKESKQMNLDMENKMQQTGSVSKEKINEQLDSGVFCDNISRTEISA